MAFANPTAYTKGQINRAGNELKTGKPSDEASVIVNTWRASHAYILNTFQAILRNRRKGKIKIGVSQRHKRLRTIASKLNREPRMQLARMDDIAGCRLIFPDYKTLYAFRKDFHAAEFAHKLKNALDKYDYIKKPKSDGYRGIHDIYEYNVNSEQGKDYNGLLLELQYRTIYQHAWATTVEIIGMVTENQPKFHAGDERHIEFFRLASEIIARAYEGSTSCYPTMDSAELLKRFVGLDKEIHVLRILRGLNTSKKDIGSKKNVILSLSEGQLDIFTYVKPADAMKKYFQLEKLQTGADIVLVMADTAKDIQFSYKSYFSDPNDFLKYIDEGCKRLSLKRDYV